MIASLTKNGSKVIEKADPARYRTWIIINQLIEKPNFIEFQAIPLKFKFLKIFKK